MSQAIQSSDDSKTSKIGKYAIVLLLSGSVAYIVYSTYKKRVEKRKAKQSNYSSSTTASLSTEWRDNSAPIVSNIDNIPHFKVRTPSMDQFNQQFGFQKHGSRPPSKSQLKEESESNISLSASAPTSQLSKPKQLGTISIGSESVYLTPSLQEKVHSPFLIRQATMPKLDLSPTFLGESSYRETVIFLLALSTNRLYPDQQLIVENTFKFGTSRRSYFCRFCGHFKFDQEAMDKIMDEMARLSEMKLELKSKFVDYTTCINMLASTNQLLSAKLVKSLNRPAYRMVGVDFDDDTSYYILQYRSTLNNTKYCSHFELHISDDNANHFVVKFPYNESAENESKSNISSTNMSSSSLTNNDSKIGQWRQPDAIRELYHHGLEMSKFLDIRTVADINEIIRQGRFKELMLVSEAYHNRQIVKISNKIRTKSAEKTIKMILISGPSSSGKTTFASKLAIQLRLLGFLPTVLEVDMWFRDREDPDHPRDSKGNLNFEVIEAVKINEFNEAITKLINGEAIQVPIFDFKIGARSGYKKESLKLDCNAGVLIMEGIFCLNPKLLPNIANVDDISFKIFICPISPFYSLDNFHFISEQVMRLVRRISRDHFHRGREADQVVFKWGQLKEGEDINIFPYVKYADAVFNSALLYELCVLKVYSYPLLQTVEQKSKQYKDAQNLISFLDMFFSMPDRSVPNDSLLMEFIGKSIFDEI